MQPRHRVSRTAIELIKRFEGYRRKAAELPDGRWTIGHGHTLTARRGAEVSPDDAEALLLYDLIAVAQALNEGVFTPLNHNQFDALASFTFNIGTETFQRSGVLQRLNEGALIQAACAMELWRKAEVGGERIVIDALVRRRSAEKALFLTPEDGAWVPAPSPILPPLLDTDAHDIVPREVPATVSETLEGDAVVVTRDDTPVMRAFPPADEDLQGPAKAVAEAITARLQTIFPDEPAPPAAEVEAPVHPENIPAHPQPQADFAPPHSSQIDPAAWAEEPFALHSPNGDEEGDDPLIQSDEADAADDDLSGPDLFDLPPAPEPQAAAEPMRGDGDDHTDAAPHDPDEDLAFLSRLPEAGHDEPSPFDDDDSFDVVAPAQANPLPEEPKGGLLTLVASAVLGLAFFGGGVFWATNARPMTDSMWLDPRVVGWLAVAAGIGFFTVSAFLLLERLGDASERTARYRR